MLTMQSPWKLHDRLSGRLFEGRDGKLPIGAIAVTPSGCIIIMEPAS